MTNTAIAQAVEPLRADAMDRARKAAGMLAEDTLKDQAAHPEQYTYPMGLGNSAWKIQKARRDRFLSLVTTKSDYVPGTGYVESYTRDEEKIAAFIAAAVEAAGLAYTAFIEKLESKVGAHSAATLEGSHVWGYSVLTVTKADGSVERWKTQQIVNVSVHGLLFNQWPSRKMKG